MLDVLFYLLDNCLLAELSLVSDYGILSHELEAAGFEKDEIDSALTWLKGVAPPDMQVPKGYVAENYLQERVFTEQEKQKLDLECRGFLLSLRQVGILSLEDLELIIERALKLEAGEVSLGQLKWLTLTTLCNREFVADQRDGVQDFNHLLFENVIGGTH